MSERQSNNTDRKIIFVVGTLESGGIERSVTEWCLYLKKNTSWSPSVICILEKKGIFLKTLEEAGIDVIECRLKNKGFAPFTFRIAKVIRRLRGEIVHSQVAFSLLWQTWGFTLGGAKRIIFTQQNEYQNWNAFPAKLRLRTYYFLSRPFIDYYTCVSERVRKNLSALLGVSVEKFKVIHNSVNVEMFYPQPERRTEARNRMGVQSGEFCLGVVANYSRQKGHHFLLEACRLFKTEVPDAFRLVLIGGGDFQPLKSQADQLGLAESVIFLGKRTDVDVLLQGMDCFVLPSLWEGLPLALLEAMSCQVPSIASDTSGIAEIIEHEKTGLLATPADPVSLKNALVRMVRNPDLAKNMAREGSRWVSAEFGLHKIMQQYIQLYQLNG